MELNRINDNTIKEKMSNLAIKLLYSNKLITPDEIAITKFNYGYIFTMDDGTIQALFKAMINGKNYYFALQKNKFQLLKLNEALYKTLVLNMKQLHPCLSDDNK